MTSSARLFDYVGGGLEADRPAAASIARMTKSAVFYYATDTKKLYALNTAGTGWDYINAGGGGGGGPRVPVNLGTLRPLADFTPVNISGARSLIENPGKAITILDTSPIPSTTLCAGISIPAPGVTPYRCAAFIQYNSPGFQFHGPCWGWQDAAGKIQIMTSYGGDDIFVITQYSDPNSRASFSNTSMNGIRPMAGGLWLGWRNDGTYLWFEISADGAYFGTVLRVPITSYLADAGKIFLGLHELQYAYPDGPIHPFSMSVLDYVENALDRQAGGA